MKRCTTLILTVLLILLGLSLMVMGIMNGRFSQEEYRPIVAFTLIGGFAVLLTVGLIFPRYADEDYQTVFSSMFLLLSLGLVLLGIFFAVIWALVSEYTYGVLLAVMLILYGLALIMAGVMNNLLSQKAYRAYMYDFIRDLPYIYYRYRT